MKKLYGASLPDKEIILTKNEYKLIEFKKHLKESVLYVSSNTIVNNFDFSYKSSTSENTTQEIFDVIKHTKLLMTNINKVLGGNHDIKIDEIEKLIMTYIYSVIGPDDEDYTFSTYTCTDELTVALLVDIISEESGL